MEQQRQADKAENQKRYDEIQQELQEWENKLQELRVTRAQSQKFVFPFLQFLVNLIITLLVLGFVCLTLLFFFFGLALLDGFGFLPLPLLFLGIALLRCAIVLYIAAELLHRIGCTGVFCALDVAERLTVAFRTPLPTA